ncbi:hypothetical protein [Endozoicomonas ascidiicola]|uniref:hypothetical protein n=1 Tax=Endozoicomonas ascidiicola TaxID=1698521 RepID=UPI000835385F|nr:hypothetical protein [Endozoicomonas ascidiicola]
MIRETHPGWWGNWSLDSSIAPGAIGVIDNTTGTFQSSGQSLSDISLATKTLSEDIKISTSHVIGPQVVSFSLDGDHEDDSANIDLKWQFTRKGAMLTQWNLGQELSLKKPLAVIESNKDLLKAVAQDMDMYAPSTGVSQGFGVITGVLMAKSGLNVASTSSASQWSITGQASAVQSLLGKGSAKAGYSSAGGDNNVISMVWPNEANTTTDELVPIAYTFASLNGEHIIPFWVEEIDAFEISFHNNGSYIALINLTYDTPEGPGEKSTEVTGFLSRTIGNIPLNATDLKLKIQFVDAIPPTTEYYSWSTPLGSWHTGERHIDIWGWWPGYPSFTVREHQSK